MSNVVVSYLHDDDANVYVEFTSGWQPDTPPPAPEVPPPVWDSRPISAAACAAATRALCG